MFKRFAFAVSLAAMLAACGGGHAKSDKERRSQPILWELA